MAVIPETGYVAEAPVEKAGSARAPAAARGLTAAQDGEEKVAVLHGTDGASFVLTDRRIVYHGGAGDESVYASVRLEDVSGVELARRPRDSRPLIWAALGIIGAIGVWQISSNGAVGAAAGIVVGLISAGLFADYWFRPGGWTLRFRSAGGAVGGPVASKHTAQAEAFVAQVELSRAGAKGRPTGASREQPAQQGVRPGYPAV